MDKIPTYRCSDIVGCPFYRYMVDYKRLDKVDTDYIDDRFVSQVSFKTIISFPKCMINKILHGSSSFKGRTGLLSK